MALDATELKQRIIDKFQASSEVDYPDDGDDAFDTAEPGVRLIAEAVTEWIVGLDGLPGADLDGVADAGINTTDGAETSEDGPLSGGVK